MPTAEHTAAILFLPQQSQHYINFAATFKLPHTFAALLVQNTMCVKCFQEFVSAHFFKVLPTKVEPSCNTETLCVGLFTLFKMFLFFFL